MKPALAVVTACIALVVAETAQAATLRLTPAKGKAGSRVTAVGTGFARSTTGVITLGGSVVARPRTSAGGRFAVRFRVPRLAVGTKAVLAQLGSTHVRSAFTVTRRRPRIGSTIVANSSRQRMLLTPTAGKTGSWVNVSGVGFPRGGPVRVSFAGAMQSSFRATARGAFLATTARFRLPASRLGLGLVTVSSGRIALAAPYRVLRCGLTAAYLPVCTPYTNDFKIDAGGLKDSRGVGTGFNVFAPRAGGGGYLRNSLTLNRRAGTLAIAATPGLASSSSTQDNMLGVGVHPGKVAVVTTTLSSLPVPKSTNTSEQAGLWFGNDQDNYVKLVFINATNGPSIQLKMEINGTLCSGCGTTKAISQPAGPLTLSLEADPGTGKITGAYTTGTSTVSVGSVTAPDGSNLFTNDAAGLNPLVGTKSFAGIFASSRNGPSGLVYTFDDFSLVLRALPAPPPPSGNINFTKVAVGGTFDLGPTAMVFGPDGKLYVTELLGRIHRMTISPTTHKVTNDEVATPLGTRLTLGIAIDPASTASNVILWVAHSDPDLSNPNSTTGVGGAAANSGVISKLTGSWPSLTVTNRVTGLPRSQANHSTNEIHFGPDGRLYIAQGGNTGAGAPNSSTASLGEFGWREEQPLTSAILVADVNAAGFDGSCDNTSSTGYADHNGDRIYGANPCDVRPYATGFRNPYDFVWHTNGSMYAADNGESVGPSYPKVTSPNSTASCAGEAPYPANSPGTQNDFLMRVTAGRYYGHPDPHRIDPNGPECVYKDGSLQGVSADPDYTPPIADLGPKRSADGIIQYKGGAFGGALNGNLLITYYSQGDYVARIVLSADGKSVVSQEVLIPGLTDPLPLVEGQDGTVYVGEFGSAKLTAFVPS